MANESCEAITVELLADHPHLIPALGELCWREWGHAPEPVDLEWWIATTAREAGRERLPLSWAAIDAAARQLAGSAWANSTSRSVGIARRGYWG